MEKKGIISKELAGAREYEEKQADLITDEMRPAYHFSPRTGWLNDPNGLSYYDGKYHLFYQYHPYSTYWGPMHWGHAVSEDLISWEYLPTALAPDTEYDYSGCFSGSAVTMDDGSHMLMYTSCGDSSGDPTGKGRWIQMQSIAIRKPGESEYAKYEGNPVISADDLPEGGDPYEFRDPYMWRCNDGSYRALVANGRTSAEEGTRLLLFRSEDGLHWSGGKVLFEDERRIGVMWECPNFFPLGGRHILMASPMDMQAEEGEAVGSIRFPQGNNVCYITGDYDEQLEEFCPDADDADAGYFMYEPVDGGLDFYAPQTFETVDGRRVMIGWMQDPSMANLHSEDEFRIFGQMTVPRELTLKDGRLIQWPVSELEKYRQDPVVYRNISIGTKEAQVIEGSLKDIQGHSLNGIHGRMLDLELEIRPDEAPGKDAPGGNGGLSYREFAVRFAAGDSRYTEFRYDPERSVVTVDRSHSGQSGKISGKRTIRVRERKGRLSIRMLIDRWSAEIFINNGEQVMSLTYYTDLSAEGIEFLADGTVTLDAAAYRLAKK